MTVQVCNSRETASDEIAKFMSRVVPWPGALAPGWVNIHWKSSGLRDFSKDLWAGRPVKNLNDFMWWIGWTKTKPTIKDVYFCTSLQAEISKNTKGNPKAVRSKELALLLKAIWLDVDVKEPPKGYATLADALAAVEQFVKAAALPPPSALIATGGGLHVYWISSTPMTVQGWQPYAEGLKALALKHGLRCDAGLTTDAARILRVPGTKNYKTEPPRPVRVLGLRDVELDYDFTASLAELPKLTPSTCRTVSSLPRAPAAAFAAQSRAEGIGREEMPSLDWVPMAKECAFFREALKTGGKDYSEPLWHLTTLLATFLENGEKLAHKMGNQHPGIHAREYE